MDSAALLERMRAVVGLVGGAFRKRAGEVRGILVSDSTGGKGGVRDS